ncbi:MAG: TetR/AcrR family transcriptional regulator [Cyanobacteria bacterium J06598_3]
MKLFHQRGYDGVGVAELSKAIGITAPSLYSAFGNKQSLFEQVLQRYVQDNGEWLTAVLALEDTLDHTMTRLFLCAAKIYSTDPERPGCLVIDGTRNCCNDEARLLTAGFRQATRQLIGDRIAADEPNLSQAAINTLSDYVLTILVGLSGSARDGMTAAALAAIAEIAATGFIQQLQQYRDEADKPKNSA